MNLKASLRMPRSGKNRASAPQAALVQQPVFPQAEVPSSFKEVYPLIEPYAYAAIARDTNTGGMLYFVIEPTLLEEEKALYAKIRSILVEELDVDVRKIGSIEEAAKFLRGRVEKTVKEYKFKIAAETLDKLMYYFARDLVNLGRIEPLMRDHMIEDISCDGPGVPLFVWHRQYESIPTNIKFEAAKELDNFVVKLAYLCNKHVSIASPMVDGGLPDGSRIQLTYAKEVTRHGSSFTIRRFKADPLTITDMITFNTITSEIGAYFWYRSRRKPVS